MQIRFVLFSLILAVFTQCMFASNRKLLGYDVEIFKDTEVYKVAKYIEKGDTTSIRKFFERKPKLIDVQEPVFGFTLLSWAVFNNHLEATRTLTNLGANPNIVNVNNENALLYAAGKYETSEFLKIILEGGKADVNFKDSIMKVSSHCTALHRAVRKRLESVQLLLDYGADITINCSKGKNTNSLLDCAVSSERMEIVAYLVMDLKLPTDEPMFVRLNGDSIYIEEALLEIDFLPNSEDYKLRQKILEYLKMK